MFRPSKRKLRQSAHKSARKALCNSSCNSSCKSRSSIRFTKSKSAAPQNSHKTHEPVLRAILGRDLLRHSSARPNRERSRERPPTRTFIRKHTAARGAGSSPAPAQVHLPVRKSLSLQARLETQQMRVWVCTCLVGFAFLFVFAFMVKVTQPFAESELRQLAQVVAESERPRAPIVDRNGKPLAQDLPSFSLYANPQIIRNPQSTAQALTQIFPSLEIASLTRRLQSDKTFVWVQRHISPRSYEAVMALGEPGLEVIRDRQRGYPLGALAPHVVGITDPDRHGLSGIERAFQDRLADSNEPLVLSLDLRVQHALKDELQHARARFSAKAAFGIVADANSGEIIAMVSLPDYNPNDRSQITEETAFNHAALGVYEFGSVFKIFTLARALDLNKEILKTRYDVSRPLRIGRFPITDYRPKKTSLLFPEVLVHSSNIGTVQVMESFGGETLKAGLKSLGLTSAVNTELPESGLPILPTTWRRSNYVTASYGHGISVSPLQLIRATSAIVNGGVLTAPTLLKQESPAPAPRVLSTQASETMRSMMRLVVTDGTGRNAEAHGYLIGGKTGTADKVSPNGGYSEDKVMSSFLSAFPMDNPRYVILIAVDEPQGRKDTHGYATAGWVAAPATGRLVQRIAPLLGVAPVESKAFDARAAHLLQADEINQFFALAPTKPTTRLTEATGATGSVGSIGSAQQAVWSAQSPQQGLQSAKAIQATQSPQQGVQSPQKAIQSAQAPQNHQNTTQAPKAPQAGVILAKHKGESISSAGITKIEASKPKPDSSDSPDSVAFLVQQILYGSTP